MYQKWRSDVLYLKMPLQHIYRITLETKHSKSENLDSGLGFVTHYLCDLE